MILYGYWRSSASWRVRIGLHLKGVPFEYHAVNLLTGENGGALHQARNAFAQVPVLEREDGARLTQSVAILTWLDAVRPEPPLFPEDPWKRARALALAEMVNAGIQPLQNLPLLGAIEALGGDRKAWGEQVISRGLHALQQNAAPTAGRFLYGDQVTIADLFLVPQLYNARRFGCDLSGLELLTTIEAHCQALPAFQKAHPSVQPDAVESA